MAVEITTLPVETAVATGDLLVFTDVSETPDALNAITVDNLLGASPMKIASTSPTLGVGYATGAGGAQTQATSKSTTVVSNTITTAITMHNATLNADTAVSFTFTNSAITSVTDQIIVTRQSGGTAGAYIFDGVYAGAGSGTITVRNITAGNLGEAIVLRVTILRAVSA